MTNIDQSTHARRFAKAALSIYQPEGTFDVSLTSGEDLDATVAAFVELGCAVSADRRRNVVTVTVP